MEKSAVSKKGRNRKRGRESIGKAGGVKSSVTALDESPYRFLERVCGKADGGEGGFLPVSCVFLFAVGVLTYICIYMLYISPSYGILSFMDAEQLSVFPPSIVFLIPRVKGACRANDGKVRSVKPSVCYLATFIPGRFSFH